MTDASPPPKAHSIEDAAEAMMAVLETLINELVREGVLSVEKGQFIFDRAEDRARKSGATKTAEVIRGMAASMNWERLAQLAAKRRGKEQN
jgi:hypothetical protein